MKTKFYFLVFFTGIIIFVFSTIVFSSIANASRSKQIEGTNTSSTVIETSIQQQYPLEGDCVSADEFLKFINSNPILKNNDNLVYLNSVDIEKKWDDSGNAIYFAKTTSQYMWGCGLYIIKIKGNKIIDVIDTGLGGNREYFSYDVVQLSQGDFIVAFCSSHMGNGNLVLMPISDITRSKYGIPDVIDNHYEDMHATAIEYGLAPENDENVTASAVYLGGTLHADYVDANQDGNTDVVLTGIQRIYETGDNNEQILRQEYYVRNAYLYDSIIDDFVVSEKMSVKIQIQT
jgi:hypothetical protein